MRTLDDLVSIQGRTRTLLAFIVAVLTLCASAYWLVQIVRGGSYDVLAENNQFYVSRLPAPRGKILDRNSEVVLVDNRPSFNLYIIPELSENIQKAVDDLATRLDLAKWERKNILQNVDRLRSFQPVLIKEDIPFELMAYFESRKNRYPWIRMEVNHKRFYPHKSFASHLLGRVGEVTPRQLQSPNFTDSPPGSMVGQSGIELRYQNDLHGNAGNYTEVRNSLGRVMREVSRENPVPGRDLLLTIDFKLQNKAEELFEGKAGTLVALDVRNGEILAMVSSPSFDPNSYREQFSRLSSDKASPLQNRAISSKFSPGSVWKTLIALAAFHEGLITTDSTEFCGGVVRLYNNNFHCNSASGHGWVNVSTALTRSCNIFFYKTGTRLGIDKIAKWARRFGFGELTGIDLPFEVPGLVPTPEWKQKARNQEWWPGETVSVSIGQGPLEVTPLQMAVFMAAVANGGKIVQPHLVRGYLDQSGTPILFEAPQSRTAGIRKEAFDVVRDGLWGTVNRGGTAVRARIPEIRIAGKTGSAQVVRKRFWRSNSEDMPEEFRHHAWFVSFAPYKEPEIAVVVFVEHGGSSSLSAVPIARDFYRQYAQMRSARNAQIAANDPGASRE